MISLTCGDVWAHFGALVIEKYVIELWAHYNQTICWPCDVINARLALY
jgi:hypothetical protein